jgi:hypothetical protein
MISGGRHANTPPVATIPKSTAFFPLNSAIATEIVFASSDEVNKSEKKNSSQDNKKANIPVAIMPGRASGRTINHSV